MDWTTPLEVCIRACRCMLSDVPIDLDGAASTYVCVCVYAAFIAGPEDAILWRSWRVSRVGLS